VRTNGKPIAVLGEWSTDCVRSTGEQYAHKCEGGVEDGVAGGMGGAGFHNPSQGGTNEARTKVAVQDDMVEPTSDNKQRLDIKIAPPDCGGKGRARGQ
jgi:hypothetical protein